MSIRSGIARFVDHVRERFLARQERRRAQSRTIVLSDLRGSRFSNRLIYERLEDRRLLAAIPFENFDSVTAPNLPAGWTQITNTGNNWTTVSSGSEAGPNHAFIAAPAAANLNGLFSPTFFLSPLTPRLTFRHNFNTEPNFDGGVLEISINGGAYADIVTAGGSFVTGGYVSTITGASALAGRQAWSGDSLGYITTTVDLPSSAFNQNVQLSWTFATDATVSDVGWRVDSIVLDGDVVPNIDLANLTPSQGTVVYGAEFEDRSGFSVSDAGDVNGDGYDDFVIGASRGDAVNNAKNYAGESYLIFGKPDWTATPSIDLLVNLGTTGVRIFGASSYDRSGGAVSNAGDINGDGFGDFVIGAETASPPGNNRTFAGKSYVIFGKANWSTTPTIDLANLGAAGIAIFGVEFNDRSGHSLSSAGDVNGDGFDDLLIGTLLSGFPAGKSYLIFGKANWSTTPTLDLASLGTAGVTILGAELDDNSGRAVTGAGDVNGDGFDDFLVGAYTANSIGNLQDNAGETYLIFGKANWSATPTIELANLGTAGVTIFGIDGGDFSGVALSNAGDVNGDGFDDLIVAANGAESIGNTRNLAGETYLIFGRADWSTTPTINLANLGVAGVTIFGDALDDYSGSSVSGAGDVNGDGYDDLIIGAPSADAAANRRLSGESYVIFGKANWIQSPTIDLANLGMSGFKIFGVNESDKSANSVSAAGDVNGDGFDDLIIGASFADSSGNFRTDAGESYLIFGRDFTLATTHPGTGAGESLNGNAGANVLNAGRGNDTLNGNGGLDVLIGGQGDDNLISDLSFRRIVGGTGNDTLGLLGSGQFLSLPQIADNRILGIETINISGTGNNTLALNRREVLNISDSTNTLTVLGNSGDRVEIELGWTRGASAGGFQIFTFGAATLKVGDAITVSVAFDLASLLAGQGVTLFAAEGFDNSGISVSDAGDVNGDGFDDIVIGSPGADAFANGKTSAGESYLIFGKPDWSATPTIDLANLGTAGVTIYGADSYDVSGRSVSAAGDVNGDGFDDFVIGAYAADASGNAKLSAGESYLIFGKANWAATPTIDLANLGTAGVTIFGALANDVSGISVSTAGDVNSDGYDDLIIGAISGSDPIGNALNGAGKSYLIFGKANWSTTPTINLASLSAAGVTIFGIDDSDFSGISVSSAGDINGDGFDDFVIGAFRADASGNAKVNAGESYLIFGKANWSATPTINLASLGTSGVTIFGADVNDQSGFSVNTAGDVNGDGFDDLIIGAYSADASGDTKSYAGDSYLIFGKADWSATPTINLASLGTAGVTIFGADVGDRSGRSVSGAGDVNGDGFDDLIIGAHYADAFNNSRSGAGENYLIFGKANWSATPIIDLANLGTSGITIFGGSRLYESGRSVSSAGDVNGDGFDDLVIGGTRTNGNGTGEGNRGRSYILFGGNFTNSITHLGTAASETLTGTSAANVIVGGRGNDTLLGSGGADVMIGGQGADILAISDLAFKRIVGGTGNDTLRLDGAGISLNLTTIPDNRILDIETIDISGIGNNTLTLTQREVLNLSSSTNTLTVRRNIGDIVNRGSGWTQGPNTVSSGLTFEVFTQGAARLNVQLVSQPPVIASIGAATAYTPNSPRVLVFPTATITDPDNVNFANALLTVTNTNGQSTDSLAIIPTANITVSAGNVLFNGTIIGTFTGGVATTPLAFTFNNQASFARVQLVLNAIGFASSSAAPIATSRTISVQVTDGIGGTSPLQSKLVNINQVPVIGAIGAAATYSPGGPRVLVFPTATITDPDTVNFANSVLTVTNTNGQATDSLAIVPTAIVTASGANVLFNGTIIGSFTGGTGTTPFVFTFNNQASFARVQLVLNTIGFASSLAAPTTTARTVTARVTDGVGGISTLQSKLVNINQIPVIGSIGAAATYNPSGPRVLVFPTATITDPNTVNFANAVLTITNTNGQATDSLAIIPTATITVSGANVLFNGTIMGTFTGGASTTPLVFTFNNQASFARVQLVLNTIGFASALPAPITTARTVSVRVTDGVGGVSALQSKLVNINQIPVIGSIGAAATYNKSGPRVLVFPTATITDPNTVVFTNGVLTVTNTNGQATDSVAIIPTASITVAGANVLFNGTVIGTFTGGTGTTPLTFTFNNQASFSRVQLVLNAIGFASTLAAPSLTPRTITVRVTDGIGGTSALQSKLVNII